MFGLFFSFPSSFPGFGSVGCTIYTYIDHYFSSLYIYIYNTYTYWRETALHTYTHGDVIFFQQFSTFTMQICTRIFTDCVFNLTIPF